MCHAHHNITNKRLDVATHDYISVIRKLKPNPRTGGDLDKGAMQPPPPPNFFSKKKKNNIYKYQF